MTNSNKNRGREYQVSKKKKLFIATVVIQVISRENLFPKPIFLGIFYYYIAQKCLSCSAGT